MKQMIEISLEPGLELVKTSPRPLGSGVEFRKMKACETHWGQTGWRVTVRLLRSSRARRVA